MYMGKRFSAISLIILAIAASACIGTDSGHQTSYISEGDRLEYIGYDQGYGSPIANLTFAEVTDESYSIKVDVATVAEQDREVKIKIGKKGLSVKKMKSEAVPRFLPVVRLKKGYFLSSEDINSLMNERKTIKREDYTISRSKKFNLKEYPVYNVTFSGGLDVEEYTVLAEKPYPVVYFNGDMRGSNLTLESIN
jgi:hypothetical protein